MIWLQADEEIAALQEQLSTLNLSMKRLQVRQTAPRGTAEGLCMKLLLDKAMYGAALPPCCCLTCLHLYCMAHAFP